MRPWIKSLTQYPGLFVTGTDTGVGKTWIGRQVLQSLHQNNVPVCAYKPVESGWPEAVQDIQHTDAWQLASAIKQEAQLDIICPNRFAAALSPPRAAQLENQQLHIAAIAQQCQYQAGEFLYVEGAGGFFSPLAHDGLNADLAKTLNLPVLLVVADQLGCINHTLLTVAAIEQRQLPIAAIVLNQMNSNDQNMDNLTDLRELLDYPIYHWQSEQSV